MSLLDQTINVSISNTPIGLGNANINTIGIFTVEQPTWAGSETHRIYFNASSVGIDYGTTSEAYEQAVAIFSQSPNPTSTGGYVAMIPLIGTPIPPAPAVLTGTATVDVTTLVAGAYDVNLNGTEYSFTLGGVPATAQDVVDAFNSAQDGGLNPITDIASLSSDNNAGTVVTFNITSVGTGSATSLTLSASAGTDIAPLLNFIYETEVGTDAEVLDEPILDAVTRIQDDVAFQGILLTQELSDVDLKALSAGIQGTNRLLFVGKSNLTAIAGVFTDIKNASEHQTRCLAYYNSGNNTLTDQRSARKFASAYAGRGMSTNFAGAGTAITMNLNELVTILPDPYIRGTVKETLIQSAETAGVDIYVGDPNGQKGVISNGANLFYDEIYNRIWFKGALQVSGYNVLKTTPTKIPQTETAMTFLKNALARVCEQAVTNGYVANGSWTLPDTFGDPERFLNNILTNGFYIYSQPVVLQDPADRASRKAPLVQIAIKSAGAIHSVDLLININL